MPETYTFIWGARMGYPDYADAETGQMLDAEPGKSYQIRAIDLTREVPPPDGRWVAEVPPPPPAKPPAPSSTGTSSSSSTSSSSASTSGGGD